MLANAFFESKRIKALMLFLIFSFCLPFFVYSQQNSPNGFVENKGQVIDDDLNQRMDVLCTYELPGIKLFFFKNKIRYVFHKMYYEETAESKQKFQEGDLEAAKMLSMRIAQSSIDLHFVDANTNPAIVFNEKKEHYVNFYRGDQKLHAVPVFGELLYKNIFPNVDIVFKAQEQGLKYDIVLHKGARISDIQFKYDGIDELSIENQDLFIKNDFVSFSENIPASYYMQTNEAVDVNYKITNTSAFSFTIDGVSDIISESIVIDPSLVWSTYFQRTVVGSSSSIRGNTEVDDSGNLFYQICTYSANLPLANPGGVVYYNPNYNPSSGLDIYFAKFDINRDLVWSTYLGGTDGTQSNYYDHGISFYGNTMYITGETDASNFPLQNQGGGAYYQTYPGSGSLGFLSKFAITTGQMIHSTYVRVFEKQVVAADNNGNVVVVGRSTSSSVTPTILTRTGAYNQASFVGSSSNLVIYMFDDNMIQTWGT